MPLTCVLFRSGISLFFAVKEEFQRYFSQVLEIFFILFDSIENLVFESFSAKSNSSLINFSIDLKNGSIFQKVLPSFSYDSIINDTDSHAIPLKFIFCPLKIKEAFHKILDIMHLHYTVNAEELEIIIVQRVGPFGLFGVGTLPVPL